MQNRAAVLAIEVTGDTVRWLWSVYANADRRSSSPGQPGSIAGLIWRSIELYTDRRRGKSNREWTVAECASSDTSNGNGTPKIARSLSLGETKGFFGRTAKSAKQRPREKERSHCQVPSGKALKDIRGKPFLIMVQKISI